jgi:hypothetical protein
MSLFILATVYLFTALMLVLFIDHLVGIAYRLPPQDLPPAHPSFPAKLLRKTAK